MTEYDINRIKDLLPHRYPFLLIDRVLECKAGESVVAIKNVSINEPFFEGHFPNLPIMPGVLILESMAQACGVLTSVTLDVENAMNGAYYFVGVDKARFKRPVVPGDQMRIEGSITRRLKGIWKYSVAAYVDGQLCCAAELMCTYQERDK